MASCNILLHKIETPGWVGFDLVWLGLVGGERRKNGMVVESGKCEN